MEIEYSSHLKFRLKARNIPYRLPEKIFKAADRQYQDTATGTLIAVTQTKLYGKLRQVMVAYTQVGNLIKIITIHPLKEKQEHKRIDSGRWKPLT